MHAPMPDADELRALARDVRTGLGAHPKALPSRWFYDDAGSRLFQAIMALPEYYLSRVEAQLLRTHADALAHWLLGARRAAPCHLIELGSNLGNFASSAALALLQRLNRELGMDFVPAQFRHYACYDPLTGLARSFLVSRCAQGVTSTVLGQGFAFAAGECLCTEQSQKYTLPMLAEMAQASGWRLERRWVDAALPYALCGWRAV